MEDETKVSVLILGSPEHYPEFLELELWDVDGKTMELPRAQRRSRGRQRGLATIKRSLAAMELKPCCAAVCSR